MSGRVEVSRSAITTASQEAVFDLLADGSTWPKWSPINSFKLVVESPGGGEGVGAIRQFGTGLTGAQEEIVLLDSPTAFAYKLVKSKVLHVRDYRADVTLAPHAEGTTITWAGSFRPLFPGSGWIWKRVIDGLYRQFAEGLATHSDQLATEP